MRQPIDSTKGDDDPVQRFGVDDGGTWEGDDGSRFGMDRPDQREPSDAYFEAAGQTRDEWRSSTNGTSKEN